MDRILLSLIITGLLILVSAFIETIVANYIALHIINKHTPLCVEKIVWKTFRFCILSDVIGLLCSFIICPILTESMYELRFYEFKGLIIGLIFIITMVVASILCIVLFSYFKILKNTTATKKKRLLFSILIAVLSAPYFAFIPFVEFANLLFHSLG